MWESTIEGQALKFHLAGINNQNFIMRDEQTGSWWQQVSGAAIQGPMKGKQLGAIHWDELTFGAWKREQPQGRVLKPDERVAAKYERADWEDEYAKLRVIVPTAGTDPLGGRALIIGIEQNGAAKAYPVEALQKQKLILDELGGVPILVVLGEDGKSVRAFDRRVESRTLEFFLKTEGDGWQLVDAETGGAWDFRGQATSDTLAGRQLKPITTLKDYWFDWKLYHPKTAVYLLGERLPK